MTTKELFLKEAQRIGDQLLAKAETHESGMYWKTMTIDDDQNTYFKESETIYSGVSGIILFFLELYKQTRDNHYRDAAREGMKWVKDYCQKNPSDYYAFFTGRMGVPYTLLQMYRFFGEEQYLADALSIARRCKNYLEDPGTINDLIGGRAGTLLVLMHLHAASGEKWILETIDFVVRSLLEEAHHGPVGLYWDLSPQHISGLCGFSHGAAGIGFVFLELGYYFQNPAFYWAAEQAFLYERYFYKQTKKNKNWPDFRKGIYSDKDYQEHKEAFTAGNLDFFTKGSDMNAWCHGAAGIGLSRVRAWQLLKKSIYKDEIQIAVEKTTLTDIESPNPSSLFILCHGRGGNAELFLSAYQVFKEKKYLAAAEKIAGNILEYHETHRAYLPGFPSKSAEEDTSLFMGNAGIGYFFLRLLDPLQVPSILAPIMDTHRSAVTPDQFLPDCPGISNSLADLQQRLLQKDFQRTLLICEEIMPRKLRDFFNSIPSDSIDTGVSFLETFITFVEKNIPALPAKEKEILSDVFELELEKRRMAEEIKSQSLLNIKEKLLFEQAEKIVETNDEAFLNLVFHLEPDIHLTNTQWNWNNSNREHWKSNLDREKEEEIFPILLKPGLWGMIESELSPFSYTILYEFQEPNPVHHVIRATIEAFESLTPEEEEMLKGQIIRQIKQALSAGILIPDKVK